MDAEQGCGGSCMEGFLWVLSVFLCCITFPFSLFVIMRKVQVCKSVYLITKFSFALLCQEKFKVTI